MYWSIIMPIFGARNGHESKLLIYFQERKQKTFCNSAITVLQIFVIKLGAGLGVWGVVNLLEGYGNNNRGAKSQGMKILTFRFRKIYQTDVRRINDTMFVNASEGVVAKDFCRIHNV